MDTIPIVKNWHEVSTDKGMGRIIMDKSIEQIRKELINSGDIHLANLEKELNDRELSHLIELVKKKGFDRG